MKITISNAIIIDLKSIDGQLCDALKKHFRVKSPEYLSSNNKREFSESEKYILMYEIKEDRLYLPRGVMDELESVFYDFGINFDDVEIADERTLLEEIDFPSVKFELRKHQKKIARLGHALSQGTFQAGCGSGKTIALLALISMCKQPSLVIVPDKTLQKQWYNNVQSVFGFDKRRINKYIGLIGDGEYNYKDKYIVIATVQTIYSHIDDTKLFNSFGFVCMDECHLCGAMSFRTSIHLFSAYYRFGATATLFRNDNLGSFIEDYIGKCFCRITDEQLSKDGLLIRPKMIRRNTSFAFKVNYKYSNWYDTLIKYLLKNYARNKMIVDDIVNESIKQQRLALIVSTRVAHCIVLANMIQKIYPTIRIGILVGDDADLTKLRCNNIELYNVEEKARSGELDLVFGVNKVKTGLDIQPLEDVYIVAPFKSQVITTQVVGRVMRPSDCFGKYKNPVNKDARIYDYVDSKIEKLLNQYVEWRLPIYEERCVVTKYEKTNRKGNDKNANIEFGDNKKVRRVRSRVPNNRQR